MPVYEIVNPSDPYTIKGELPAVRAACLLLGEGHYALRSEDGSDALPLFLFGFSFDGWAAAEGFDLKAILTEQQAAIADALDSVLIGGFSERRTVESAVAKMSPEDAALWLQERHDQERSSINDIGGRAKAMAGRLRSKES